MCQWVTCPGSAESPSLCLCTGLVLACVLYNRTNGRCGASWSSVSHPGEQLNPGFCPPRTFVRCCSSTTASRPSFKPHPRHAVLTFRKQQSGVAKDMVPTAQQVYRAALGKLFNACESLFLSSQRGR